MEDLSNFECYDNLIINPLKDIGWDADFVPWESKYISWNDYQAVIIRSTWNYQNKWEKFCEVLNEINKSKAFLYNSLNIVKWNIDKKYLKYFESKGLSIIPSKWFKHFNLDEIMILFPYFDSEKLIIKPTISANADHTYVLDHNLMDDKLYTLNDVFNKKQFIIQPFINEIKTEGEYSMMFFGNILSHVILKTPKKNDFRVQEEHGGEINIVQNPELELINFGQKILEALPEPCLFSRIDVIRYKHQFVLMEVELIEPSLYFNMDHNSPLKFAKAFNNWVKND